jgi:uncharacterized protein (TIGR02246 family)
MSDSTTTELLQKWTSAIKNGDPKQVTSLYHEHGILLGTFSAKERVGHELILEYFESLLKSPVEVQIVSEHSHFFESSAVNSGLYNFITDGKTINARFSFAYSKNDAEWKIIAHHSSVLPENS